MEIGKSNKNFKDRKPKCFNYKIYEYITRDCKKLKKEKDTRKCYESGRIEHIAKDYRTKQRVKKQSVQKNPDTDIEEEDRQKGFGEGPKWAQYKGPICQDR